MKHSFSFKYDGVPFSELNCKIEVKDNDTIYTLPDGVKLTVREEHIPKYGITKWTNYWENPTDHDGGLITELKDCDIALPFVADPPKTKLDKQERWEFDMLRLYETVGANVTQDDHWINAKRMFPGDHYETRNICGRSGMGTAPFFEVTQKEKGCIIAIGWTGAWIATFDRTEDAFRIRTGLLNMCLSMKPGEKFRTGSVTMLEYENGRENAHNAFRSYLRDISPIGHGRGEEPPFAAIFWGGVTSEDLLGRLSNLKERGLNFDTCWVDAGWYEPLSCTEVNDQLSQWGFGLGNWEVSKAYHPNGYLDVSKFLSENDMKFMLWFEPERINSNVKGYTKIIETDDKNYPHHLVAFHRDDVLQDAIEMVSEKVRTLNLGVYRQDFNIDPEPSWKYADDHEPGGSERRRGSTEIHYINNMWKFWDALLERFPHLLIDDCCGGGHRIDIEMLSRSVPMWRSDYQCTWDACCEANQNQNAWASYWYPYTGIGYGPTLGDTYSFRSAWTAGLCVRTWEHSSPDWKVSDANTPTEWARKNFNEYLKYRHYLSRDFYSLISPVHSNEVWLASQYHDADNDSGIILAFRRANCKYDRAIVNLGGIDENAQYEFENVDTGDKWTVSGSEMKNFVLEIKEMRSSLLLHYEKR